MLWSSFEHHLPLDRLIGCRRGPLRRAAGGQRDPLAGDHQLRPSAATWCCRCWRRCRCCGCGTTSSRSPGSRPARPAPGPRPSRTSWRGSCATWPSSTRCKVLLTSRRDEQAWLGGAARPAAAAADADARAAAAGRRAGRPPRPPGPGGRLAAAAALCRGQPADHHRPGRAGAARGPDHHRQHRGVRGPAPRRGSRTGAGEDAALGRTRSLAASLSYGFSPRLHRPRARPARRAAPVPRHHRRRRPPPMGDPECRRRRRRPRSWPGSPARPRSGCWTGPPASACCPPSAAATTRSTPPCPGTSPPCTPPPTARPASPAAQQAARAYTHTLAGLGDYYHNQDATGAGDPVPALRAEEANLHHALTLARAAQHWGDMPRLPAGPACPV